MIFVEEYDIPCSLKSYQLKLLGNFVVQHGIKSLFDGRLSVQTLSAHVYLCNSLSSRVSLKIKSTFEGGC